jgi:trigger factor/foldase protein PrsA
MKGIMKKAGAMLLAAGLGVSMRAGCGANAEQAVLDGTKTVVTINDEAVKMGVMSMLTRFQQAQIYQIYSMYFGTSQIFNMTMDESTGETYGETMKQQVLEDIERMVLLRQHAGDYEGIELTEDEKAEIAKTAQAYIDENTEEIRTKIGATYDDVVELLSLFKTQEKMMTAIGDAVDQEVSDEEAQQTSISYVAIQKAVESEESSDASAAESTDESKAAEPTVEEQNAEKKADAEAILTALKDSDDPAEADMDEIAKEENESYSALTGQFSTNDTSDTSLNEEIVKAAAGLSDGELVDSVIETDTYFYVVRVNKVFDESMTEAKKDEILKQRKQDSYDTLVSEWKDAASITVDEAVLATLTLSDSDVFTLLEADPGTESTAESAAESTAESTAESAAESTAAAN